MPGVVDLSELAAEVSGVAKIVLESVQDMLLKLALQMARDDYDTRRDRQRQGVDLARAAGKYTGRKPDLVTHDRILALCGAGHSIERIAQLAGCSVSQVKAAAEQLPKLDRWRTLLRYICQRILGQINLPTPPPMLSAPG